MRLVQPLELDRSQRVFSEQLGHAQHLSIVHGGRQPPKDPPTPSFGGWILKRTGRT